MFKSHYQGGIHVEIFSAQGKDPAAKWAQSGKVQRIFDKGVKSYVYLLEGGPTTKMQIPRDEKLGLSLTQPFLVLQLSVPLGVGFNIQILATDIMNNKRRIFLSSAYRDISHNPLHSRLPLGMMVRGQWVNLAINVGSILSGIFSSTFKSIEMVSISASCKLRKVFTMRHQPHNTNTGIYSPVYTGPTETIPKGCTLNIGTTTQVVDIAVIQQWVHNQAPKIQREAVTKSAPQNPLLRSKPVPRNAHSAENRRKVQSSLDSLNKQKTARKAGRQSRLQASKNHVTPGEGDKPSRQPKTRSPEHTKPADVTTTDCSSVDLRPDTSDDSSIKHSTPNPLMDRVLDVSFDTIQSRVNLERDRTVVVYNQEGKDDNKPTNNSQDMIRNIANGNISFRSSSSSQRSQKTPEQRVSRHVTRRSRDSNHVTSPRKVYNSNDYEDDSNPFAASDEDLKYRMKALAMYNGDLDESLDFSVVSRKSRRSQGVGPIASNALNSDDEIEEKLGEETDTSSSDATVLSHAQEVLLSGSVGHTSFLQDSIGKNYESRLTDRAYSPPILYPDELTRQATLPQHTTTNNPATIEEDSGEEELDLLYDPVLNCYFDPKTCKYYELA